LPPLADQLPHTALDRADPELVVFDEYAQAAVRRVRVAEGQRTLAGCPPGEWQWMQCENAATVTAVALHGAHPDTQLHLLFELAYLPQVECQWRMSLWTEEEKRLGAMQPRYNDSIWLSIHEDIATAAPRRMAGRLGAGDRLRVLPRRLQINEEIAPERPLRIVRRTPNLEYLPRSWPGA
jgi:hypothetical protein